MKTNTNASKEDPSYALPKYKGPPELENEFLGYWRSTDLKEVVARERYAWIRLLRNKQRTPKQKEAISAAEPRLKQWLNQEPKYELSGRSVLDFLELEIDPASNLLANRWLTREGSAFIIAPSGHGKSSLVMQATICWAIGRPAFAIKPAYALKILVIQSEDDDAETKKFSQMIRAMNLSEKELELLRQNTRFEFRRDLAGTAFISALDQFLTQWSADIVIINPLSGFLLCDLKDDEKVNGFLRQQLNAQMAKHSCAPIVIHHTPKLNFAKLDNMQWYDWMYAMSGCAGLTNWGRAVLVMAPSKVPGTYRFIAAKRFDEILWAEREYWFAHSRNSLMQNSKEYCIIQWVPANQEQITQATPTPKKKAQAVTAQMLWKKMDPVKLYTRESFQEWASNQFSVGIQKSWSSLKFLCQEGLVEVSEQKRPRTRPLSLYQKLTKAAAENEPESGNHNSDHFHATPHSRSR